VYFAEEMANHHGRTYGVVEAAIQMPLAAYLAFVTYGRAREGDGGHALLFGGMAAVSGALAVHGLTTAISPYEPPKLDLLGTDVTPTLVDDGKDVGPGVAATSTW
jgi:hypothetical protein